MSSAETDRRDRTERDRHSDRNLAEARAGRNRLRDLADAQQEPSHGDPPRSAHVPNASPGR